MKPILYSFIIITLCVVSAVVFINPTWSIEGQALQEEAEEKAEEVETEKESWRAETEDVSRAYQDPSKTKVEKVGDTISEIPETTGNIFLDGFKRIGDWLEEKSGNRFDTKWSPQRRDDPSLSPEHYGLDRDPAKGI